MVSSLGHYRLFLAAELKQFSAKVGFRRTIVVEDTMQYIPLTELLATILKNDHFVGLMKDFNQKCVHADPELISHYFHTDTFKNHLFF